MKKRKTNDSGIALIVVMLLMLVFTIMMLGFYFETTGEQNVAASDRDNAQTFYAAQGAIENMSTTLQQFFSNNPDPTPAEVTANTGTLPSIPIYNALGQQTSQTFSFPVYSVVNLNTNGVGTCTTLPTTLCHTPNALITGSSGLAGLYGDLVPFLLTVVADGPGPTEVKMSRQVNIVSVPVFQFGIFSTTDLSFFAGPDFGFGGKTATNGNLFLAEGSGKTLTLNDKVVGYLSVITSQLSNGTLNTSANGYDGTVDITVGESGGCPGANCSALTQGSVTCSGTCAAWTPNTTPPIPPWSTNANWKTISTGTGSGDFKQYIETGATGAKVLNLALTLQPGVTPIAMIERPCPNSATSPCTAESPTSLVGQQRFFNQASMRILLSDTQSQITEYSTQGVTASNPYPLAESGSTGMSNTVQRTNSANPYYLPAPDSCHPPMAESPGYAADSDYYYTSGTTTLGGYIKIEIQLNSNPGTWQDVTEEILSLGMSRDIQTSGTLSPAACTNTSIIHLEGKRPWPVMGALTVPAPSAGGSLTKSTAYCFVVTAVGTWGESAGTEQCASNANKTSSTCTTSGNCEYNLTWSAYGYGAAAGLTGYNVYCGTSSGNENVVYSVGNVTSYTSSSCSTTVAPTGTAGTPPTTTTGTSPAVSNNLTTSAAATTATNYVPLNIYDPREGEVRDSNSYTTASMNGTMNLVEIDVGHLQQWLAGKLVPPYSACTNTTVLSPLTGTVNSCGPLALGATPSFVAPATPQPGNYILYISDRRNNCNQTAAGPCAGGDTGQYGYEDTINPASGTGTPNGQLDNGEDTNGNGVLDVYGGIARPFSGGSVTNCSQNVDNSGATKFPTGSSTTLSPASAGTCNFTAGTFMATLTDPTLPSAAPLTRITSAASGPGYYEAQKNPVMFYRHAVRLMDGSLGNLPPYAAATMSTCPNAASPVAYPTEGGFSVATENPLYIMGDYNASNSVAAWSPDPSGKCHVPAAVFADAVTLLSDNWVDGTDLVNPTSVGSRPATSTNTWYRVAVISGKNMSFPLPTFTPAPPVDFGTDGGTHNFLRYIENWGSTLNYMGAMVSFYYAVQGTGVYKCCNTVYNPPTRAYGYDTDFANLALPPGTPRFTTVNALSYQQMVLATQ